MNRRAFGTWGIGLPPREFDQALAAALVLSAAHPREWPAVPPDDYARRLIALIRHPDSASGAVPALLERDLLHEWPAAGMLAQAWARAERELNDQEFQIIRLELTGWPSHDPTWVLQRLLYREGGGCVHAAFLEAPAPGGRRAWHIPLRVGFLPDPQSRALRARIEELECYPWLSTFVELRPGFEACDLLLVPHSLRSGFARILELPFRLQVSCLVLLGQAGDPFETERTLALALRSTVGGSALCLDDVPEGVQADWFNGLMRELSHDQPLDLALFVAQEEEGRVPILLAASGFVGRARISSAAEDLARRLSGAEGVRGVLQVPKGPLDLVEPEEAAWPEGELEELERPVGGPGVLRVPDRLADLIEPDGLDLTEDGYLPPDRFARLAERIAERARAGAFAWDAEGGDAMDFSELARALDEIDLAPAEDARHVQVRILDLGEPARPRPEERALLSERDYAFDVRIAPPEREWLAAPERFPDEELDFSQGPLKLEVVFTEPALSPEPQVGELILSATGASTACRFFVRTPQGRYDFRARIAVVYRNRVLQTVLVCGRVVDGVDLLAGDEAIQVRVESVTRPGFSHLEGRRRFDAALVLNHTSDGVPSATAIVDGQARWISTERFQRSIDYIRNKLTEMALAIRDDETRYASLESPETLELLLYLALHGSDLYQGLVADWGLQQLGGARRVQVVATDFERFLPVEFFYDRQVPDDDAPLCPQAREALRKGACQHQCPEPQTSVICPLGFWCLSRVIERHTFDPGQEVGHAGNYKLAAEPVEGRNRLRLPGSAVFGASEKVDRKVHGQRDALMHALSELLGPGVGRADTWEEWVERVRELEPSLLMLIPHTFRDRHDKAALEIGDGAALVASRIRGEHVRATQASPPPVVFLLGCETGADDLALDNFVAPFRRAQAALVVTTLSTVLGRHAAPIAQAFLERMREMAAQGAWPFGEVTLAVRQKLVAQDMPAALAIAVYGDADWLLEAPAV